MVAIYHAHALSAQVIRGPAFVAIYKGRRYFVSPITETTNNKQVI